jgi:hypothetical protein
VLAELEEIEALSDVEIDEMEGISDDEMAEDIAEIDIDE